MSACSCSRAESLGTLTVGSGRSAPRCESEVSPPPATAPIPPARKVCIGLISPVSDNWKPTSPVAPSAPPLSASRPARCRNNALAAAGAIFVKAGIFPAPGTAPNAPEMPILMGLNPSRCPRNCSIPCARVSPATLPISPPPAIPATVPAPGTMLPAVPPIIDPATAGAIRAVVVSACVNHEGSSSVCPAVTSLPSAALR